MVECDCNEWKISAAVLAAQQSSAVIHGVTYDGAKPFVFCPWCGEKLRRAANSAVGATNDR